MNKGSRMIYASKFWFSFLLLNIITLASNFAESSCPLVPTDRVKVKWNPGHFIMLDHKTIHTKFSAFLKDYHDTPAVQGIQTTYFWSELEPRFDEYDFKSIDEQIAKLATTGKKLAIILGYKFQVSSTQSSLPAYILNQSNELINGESIAPYFIQGKQGGGIYNKGHHANFGHSGTLARFKKLLDVLSARYDQNPVVASISFTETAIGTEIGAGKRYSAISEELFVKGYMMMQAHAGCVFKSTPLFQNLNFPRRALPAFIENMKTFGIGLGGPDVFVDSMKRANNGLGFFGLGKTINKYPGVYHYYPSASQVIPIGQQVHRENLHYFTAEDFQSGPAKSHNLTSEQAIDGVYEFAKKYLIPNYLFWQVYGRDAATLKKRLKSEYGMPLETSCPAIYGRKCVVK